MEFTTRFELQSQATRLFENGPDARRAGAGTGLSPSLMLFSKRLRPRQRLASPLQTTIRPLGQIYNVSSSRFTRRYWGNPG